MNMKDRNLFESLVSFVRLRSREFKKSITRETLIEDDLGVTGDDAAELILEYSKKYNVDISNFIFTKYFNEESSVFTMEKRIWPFTIGHLEKAVIAGRLDEEIINN
jgi:acyl carrier protein